MLISLYSLTERVQYAAAMPENISAIAAVLTDVKPAMYISAKRRSHQERYYYALRKCQSPHYCYFTRIHAIKHPRYSRCAADVRCSSLVINDKSSFNC